MGKLGNNKFKIKLLMSIIMEIITMLIMGDLGMTW